VSLNRVTSQLPALAASNPGQGDPAATIDRVPAAGGQYSGRDREQPPEARSILSTGTVGGGRGHPTCLPPLSSGFRITAGAGQWSECRAKYNPPQPVVLVLLYGTRLT
jgi:hypothetical protein